MNEKKPRSDDFEVRRTHLQSLSDEALKNRFWSLLEQVVDPMTNLAKNHTTPSIERSVLLRMGFSSLEAKAIVDVVIQQGWMGKGAGHVVYKLSLIKSCSILEAGRRIAMGLDLDLVKKEFEVIR